MIASVDEFMENAILKSIVNGTYSDELKKWQETFAELMSDGILSQEEADTLRDRYSDIFERARAKKEEKMCIRDSTASLRWRGPRISPRWRRPSSWWPPVLSLIHIYQLLIASLPVGTIKFETHLYRK